MASGGVRYVSCINCGTIFGGTGTLVNQSCYKCRAPTQANNWKARTDSGRSGNLGWSSRSTSYREQTEDSADERNSDFDNKRGGEFLLPSPANNGRPSVRATEKDGKLESTANRLAVQIDRSLNMSVVNSDYETSRALHGPRQSLFSTSQSVVSSEDTFDGDDSSSWNGDYPGSPHSTDASAYEPSISSEEGHLSRGFSKRTRRPRGRGEASNFQAGGSSFDSLDDNVSAASRVPPQERFYPPRSKDERFSSESNNQTGGFSFGGVDANVISASRVPPKGRFYPPRNTDERFGSGSNHQEGESSFTESPQGSVYPPRAMDERFGSDGSNQVGGSSFGSVDANMTSSLRQPPQLRVYPPRPVDERFGLDSDNQAGGSSFSGVDTNMTPLSREPSKGRVYPHRPIEERVGSDTSGSRGGSGLRLYPPTSIDERSGPDMSGSLDGSSGTRSHVREASCSSASGELYGYNWSGAGNGDASGHASSSSGELNRFGGLRANQSSSSSNQFQVKPRPPDAEGSGTKPLDDLREVNPYGPNAAPRSQPAPAGIPVYPPPPQHQRGSSASKSIHCCMHCRSNACRVFQQLPNSCCANGGCGLCSHTCCQPLPSSGVSGLQCHGKPNAFVLNTNSAQEQRDEQAPKAKEKKKRYSRPVFGGANFIMCYKCNDVLQMPEDFHFSRTRRNKLRCGSCSEVIVFVLLNKTRIVLYELAANLKIPSDTGGMDGGSGGGGGKVPAPCDGRGVIGGGGRGPRSYASAEGDGSNHSRSDQISYLDNYSSCSDGGGGSTEGTSCTRRRDRNKG